MSVVSMPSRPSRGFALLPGLVAVLGLAACESYLPPEAWTAARVDEPEVLLDDLDGPSGLVNYAGDLVLGTSAGELLRLDRMGDLSVLLEEPLPGIDRLSTVEGGLVLSIESSVSEDGQSSVEFWSPDAELTTLWAGAGTVTDLASDGSRVYYALTSSELGPASLRWSEAEGGESLTLCPNLDDPGGFSLVDERVVIADRGAGVVLACDRSDGALTVLATPAEVPRDVALAGQEVIVSARSERWPGGGWIYSMEPSGGELVPLSYSPPGLDRLIVDDGAIYWSSSQSITRVDREGGTYEVLATETRVADFIIWEGQLVWTDPVRGQLLARPL